MSGCVVIHRQLFVLGGIMRSSGTYCLMFAAVLALSGCEKYRAKPLAPTSILNDVERRRHLLAPETPSSSTLESESAVVAPPTFTFARAVELTREHSPALQQAAAEYETALALSKVKTPLQNPAFEAGPQYGFGPDVAHTNRLQPFGSIGFTIPTGKRLKRQDELNFANAELARVETMARYRELYMSLRQQYARLILSTQRQRLRKEIAESAARSTALSKKLIDAGQATGLDAGLVELEQARLMTAALDGDQAFTDVLGDLSELIGVHADHFQGLSDGALPQLPDSVPELKDLQRMMVFNHPDLARFRSRYEVAERSLRLEIAKQYPDFHIGPSFANDVGEKKSVIGLTLGIEIPVFDRNQQGVASAKQRREEVRIKYEAAANRSLAALDRAYRSYEIAIEKARILKTVVLPKAESNVALARKSVEAGAMDSLRLLETERAQRAVRVEALETELTVRNAYIGLEQAVGYPLLAFPTEDVQYAPETMNLPEDSDLEGDHVLEEVKETKE
jgi:outer membrane protein, heavy metal efflux system